MPISIAELYEGVLKDLSSEHLQGTEEFKAVEAAQGNTSDALVSISRAADLLANIALTRPKVDTIIGKLGEIAEVLRKAKT